MTTISDDNAITIGIGNVFADLGLPDAEERLLKARILMVISDTIARLGLTQTAAAERLGIGPDVSNLLRGRLRGYSLERLLSFARALGNDIEITVKTSEFEREGHVGYWWPEKNLAAGFLLQKRVLMRYGRYNRGVAQVSSNSEALQADLGCNTSKCENPQHSCGV